MDTQFDVQFMPATTRRKPRAERIPSTQARFRRHRARVVIVRVTSAAILVIVYMILAVGSLSLPVDEYNDHDEIPNPLGSDWSLTGMAFTFVRVALPADASSCPGRAQRWQRHDSTDSVVARRYNCDGTDAVGRVLAIQLDDLPEGARRLDDGYVAGNTTTLVGARGTSVIELHAECTPICTDLARQAFQHVLTATSGEATAAVGRPELIIHAWLNLYSLPLLMSWILFLAIPDAIRWIRGRRHNVSSATVRVDWAARKLRLQGLPTPRSLFRLAAFLLLVQSVASASTSDTFSEMRGIILAATIALLLPSFTRRGGLRNLREANGEFERNPARWCIGVTLRSVALLLSVGLAYLFAVAFIVSVLGGAYSNRVGDIFQDSTTAEIAALAIVNPQAFAYLIPPFFFASVSLDRLGRRICASLKYTDSGNAKGHVLYLRNFSDDLLRLPATSLSRSGVTERLSPWRSRSISEVVIKHADTFGPVEQASFPGDHELLGSLGPNSISLSENWQRDIVKLAQTSRCIVVHATPRSVNQGLVEELAVLAHFVDRNRVIFLLGFGRRAVLRDRWNSFCDYAEMHPTFNGLRAAGLAGAATAVLAEDLGSWISIGARRKTEWTYVATFRAICNLRWADWLHETAQGGTLARGSTLDPSALIVEHERLCTKSSHHSVDLCCIACDA